MRAIGYVRVSTEEQAESGLSLEAQKEKIQAEARQRDLDLVEIVEDLGVSAGSLEREGLQQVLRRLRIHNAEDFGDPLDAKDGFGEPADCLMVTRLDRLSRSVVDFSGLMERAKREGWNLIVLDLGLDLSTPNGRFVAHIMAAVAELERSMISTRTKEAMAQAKRNGVRLGRPPEEVPQWVMDYVREARENGGPDGDGLTFAEIAHELNELDAPTPSGEGQWWASTASRVYARSLGK